MSSGPEGLRTFLNAAFRSNDPDFKFDLKVHEFPRGFRGRVLEKANTTWTRLPLDHSIFCLGWRFQEKDRPGEFHLIKQLSSVYRVARLMRKPQTR